MAKKKTAKKAAAPKLADTINMLKQHVLSQEQRIHSLDREIIMLKCRLHAPPTRARLRSASAKASLAVGGALSKGLSLAAQPLGISVGTQLTVWQRLVKLCLFSLENKIRMSDPAVQGFVLSDPDQLEDYVTGQESIFGLIQLQNATYQALKNAGNGLAATHAKAATSIVDGIAPGDSDASSMLADLRSLSDDIRGDQNFTTVVNLLDAAAAAYASTPQA